MMRLHTIIFIPLLMLLALTSCRRDEIEDIDITPINRQMLLGGWRFTGVKATINSPLKTIATNVTEKFLEKTTKTRCFYFTQDTAYVVHDIEDNDHVTISRSKYFTEGYVLRFEKESRFFGSWYLPFWYVKDQTPTTMTFYLQKDEIIVLLREDGSIPSYIINKIEDGQCELYLERYSHPTFDTLQAAEDKWHTSTDTLQ